MHVEHVPVGDATRAVSGKTNAYVLGRDRAVLVDPAARHPDLDAVVDERSLAHVVVTHHHPDHVGAVADYAGEHDATVWCRYGREDDFAAAAGVDHDRTFREGTVVPADDPLTVVETPGHAPEHVAFACETPAGDALLTGDLAVTEGSVVVGAPEGDMRAYLASLRRVHARAPDVCHPGHGPRIDDPRITARRLYDHRLDREARVLAAVEGGAKTLDEILDVAYDKDVTAVRSLAVATVDAHLKKLAVEGRLRWDGERAGAR